jgi:hypothetical protein
MGTRAHWLAGLLLLGACASGPGDVHDEPMVKGPKSLLCDRTRYPAYASGEYPSAPMFCDSSLATLLVAGPGERVYRTTWMDGDMGGYGGLEVLVRADGAGWAGPSRTDDRKGPPPKGAFLVESLGPTRTVELTREQVAAFETAFAATGFSSAPLVSGNGLYNCLHGDEMTGETLIDGVWRGVVREDCDQDSVLARAVWDLIARTAEHR